MSFYVLNVHWISVDCFRIHAQFSPLRNRGKIYSFNYENLKTLLKRGPGTEQCSYRAISRTTPLLNHTSLATANTQAGMNVFICLGTKMINSTPVMYLFSIFIVHTHKYQLMAAISFIAIYLHARAHYSWTHSWSLWLFSRFIIGGRVINRFANMSPVYSCPLRLFHCFVLYWILQPSSIYGHALQCSFISE